MNISDSESLPPGISVVVPVYNSAEILPKLIERLYPVLTELHLSSEVILINDGSQDTSWAVIKRLAEKHQWVRGISLMRNYGQHNAVLCGVRAVRYKTIVTMDDDLQNPPEEIPKLVAKLNEGYDVVYGANEQGRQGILRELASQLTRFALQKVAGVKIARRISAFRAIDRKVCTAFTTFQSAYVSIDVLLSWGTTRFSWVPVRQEVRYAGTSTYTFGKLLTHGLTMMTGFSTWPLRMTSLLGFTMTGFGLAILIFIIGRFFVEGGSVLGIAFLASILTIFPGTQMFALGIIVEHLARLHFRMSACPTYVVSQKTEERQNSCFK